MKAVIVLAVALFACVAHAADTLDRTPIEGTTANGEKVLLYPTGKWEYVNTQKAVEAKKVAAQYPENQVRPPEAQGGLFGVGRLIMPGDKDYNRGSLSGK